MKKNMMEILQTSQWFNGLPADLQTAFAKHAKLKRLVQHEVIHAKGQACNGFFFVWQGKIRISNYTPAGKEVLLTWLAPGAWFGEISLFDGLPRTHYAAADEPSQVINIPSDDFQQILSRHPALYQFVMPILCQRLRQLFQLIEDARTLPGKQQLVKQLLHICSQTQKKSKNAEICVELSQESLALMLNTTRQSVNKWLNELQSEGLIQLAYQKVLISDRQKLTQYLTL